MDSADHTVLVERARSGDTGALTALLEHLYPLVRKHVTFLLTLDPAVDDVVQESMMHIYRGLDSFRRQSSIKTWALCIATRTARRHARAQRKHRDALLCKGDLDDGVFAAVEAARPELRRLCDALGELSARKREALILMEIFELSAREAGEVLGVSANTAASRCRHAKAELSVSLRKS